LVIQKLSTKKATEALEHTKLMFLKTCGVPPTIVSAATLPLLLIEIEKLEFHKDANLVKGIIVVSPCPPITIAEISFAGLSKARQIRSKTSYLKLHPFQ
jgi:hypothetical protein